MWLDGTDGGRLRRRQRSLAELPGSAEQLAHALTLPPLVVAVALPLLTLVATAFAVAVNVSVKVALETVVAPFPPPTMTFPPSCAMATSWWILCEMEADV